jgi:competence protein ComEA helix-hairpin-helix repeat region
MDDETLHVRYLMVIAAVLFALIIGYNAFYVPEVSLSDLVVTTDASASADETYIPKTGSEASSFAASALSSKPEKIADETPAVNGKININTATAQQLSDGLDGIGDVIAKRIVDYREKNGPFKSIEEIRKVSGIGEKTFAGLKDHITVS